MSLARFAIENAVEKTKAKSPKYENLLFDSEDLELVYLTMYEEIQKRRFYNPIKKIWMKAISFELLTLIQELRNIPDN